MKDKLHNYIIKKSKHKVKEWKNIKTIISFKQHNSTWVRMRKSVIIIYFSIKRIFKKEPHNFSIHLCYKIFEKNNFICEMLSKNQNIRVSLIFFYSEFLICDCYW